MVDGAAGFYGEHAEVIYLLDDKWKPWLRTTMLFFTACKDPFILATRSNTAARTSSPNGRPSQLTFLVTGKTSLLRPAGDRRPYYALR
jgi:hypothetical protein